MQVVTAAEQLFFTTIRIEATGPKEGVGPDISWVGTGFAYEVKTQQGPAHVLVTNKHVLRHARQVSLTMIGAGPDRLPQLGKAAQCSVGNMSDASWNGHPDPTVDVAVMGLSFMANMLAAQGNGPFYRCADATIALNATSGADLDALEEVVFVGYPSGLYDTTNLLPIVRRGMTATPISVDYRGLPAFLIDAAVFPGSSGSPVFILNQGMYRNRHNATVIGNRLILLGVLAEYYWHPVDGPVRQLPAQMVASVPQALGLGTVFRAETIEPCVDRFLEERGLARATNGQPPVADSAVALQEPITEQPAAE